ncbi:MAG: TolC family protein [Magnetococcales bacterium]|nr:TolC family protein [Magnetococcales bacterium]MBF0156397.1 TolC family protein [Magnetococcales bacterium]
MLVFVGIVVIPPAWADPLVQLMEKALELSPAVRSLEAKVAASEEARKKSLGEWYPTLDLDTYAGKNVQRKESGAETDYQVEELKLSVNQKLWDFGTTEAELAVAAKEVEKTRVSLAKKRQEVLLSAVKALLDVVRSQRMVAFAKEAEDNILKQTDLEKIRFEEGGGYSTDVLQAQSQYAGAESRRLRAEGRLDKDLNVYRRVFGGDPESLPADEVILGRLTPGIPSSLEEARRVAQESNRDLGSAAVGVAIAELKRQQTFNDVVFPKIDVNLESKRSENLSGVAENKTEHLAKVTLAKSFNLGLTEVNDVQEARENLKAAQNDLDDVRQTVDVEVRNAWQELDTLRAIAATTERQAVISRGFLDLARKERELGNRSLLDVLSGETTLTNALSDAMSARIDVVIGMATLLDAMGTLDLESFRSPEKKDGQGDSPQ